jgi:hypothetical protein
MRPLLHAASPLLGPPWFPTAGLALVCVGLAATGWVIGRWNRPDAVPVAIVFAAMLAVWDFGLVPAIDVRWLFRLTIDALGSSRYLESLITAVATHAVLFGSLIAGVFLSRSRQTAPISVVR